MVTGAGASVVGSGPGADGTAVELVEQLQGTLKALAAVDLGACDPEDLAVLTVGLARAEAMVGAQSARAADAWRASGLWASSGARTAKAWLVDRTGEAAPTRGRRLALGHAMRHLPEAGAAFEAGEISADHVRRLQAARNPRTAEVLARDEAWLVDQAKLLSYAEFDRVVTYWMQHADPDGAAQSAEEARAARSAWLAETIGGMSAGKQTFDPLSGAIVAAELERLEKLLFDEDRAEARKRLGRHPRPDELSRTPAPGRRVGGDGQAVRGHAPG